MTRLDPPPKTSVVLFIECAVSMLQQFELKLTNWYSVRNSYRSSGVFFNDYFFVLFLRQLPI